MVRIRCGCFHRQAHCFLGAAALRRAIGDWRQAIGDPLIRAHASESTSRTDVCYERNVCSYTRKYIVHHLDRIMTAHEAYQSFAPGWPSMTATANMVTFPDQFANSTRFGETSTTNKSGRPQRRRKLAKKKNEIVYAALNNNDEVTRYLAGLTDRLRRLMTITPPTFDPEWSGVDAEMARHSTACRILQQFADIYDSLDAHSNEITRKPNFSYTELIFLASLKVTGNAMSVSSIYDFVTTHYAYYTVEQVGVHWKNGIRHSLSKTKCFQKLGNRRVTPVVHANSDDANTKNESFELLGGELEAYRKNAEADAPFAKASGSNGDAAFMKPVFLWSVRPEAIWKFVIGDYRVAADDATGLNSLRWVHAHFEDRKLYEAFWQRVATDFQSFLDRCAQSLDALSPKLNPLALSTASKAMLANREHDSLDSTHQYSVSNCTSPSHQEDAADDVYLDKRPRPANYPANNYFSQEPAAVIYQPVLSLPDAATFLRGQTFDTRPVAYENSSTVNFNPQPCTSWMPDTQFSGAYPRYGFLQPAVTAYQDTNFSNGYSNSQNCEYYCTRSGHFSYQTPAFCGQPIYPTVAFTSYPHQHVLSEQLESVDNNSSIASGTSCASADSIKEYYG